MRMDLEALFAAIQAVQRRVPEVPLLAIPWMQMKHPVHPVQRQLLERAAGGKRGPALSGARRAGRALLSLVYAAYLTLRVAQIRVRNAPALRALRKQRFDLLVKSWRFERAEGSTTAEPPEDFYYGDLQRRLKAKGLRVLLLYNYPRGRAWREQACPSGADGPQLQELCLLPLSAPIRLVLRQWITSMRLGRLTRDSRGLEALVAEQARGDCLSHRDLLAGLSHWVFQRAVQIWRPKGVLTLYEGHAWERIAWAAAKEVDLSCRTIGYQHTILLPHQLSLLRPAEAESPDAKPDIVLCLGPRTEEMLRPGHPRSRLIPFGTFRRAALAPNGAGPAPQRKTVLVLPEAHREEMDLLFRTAVEAAELLPDHRFILRCHPILPSPLRQVLSSVGRDPRSLPNVEISSGRRVEEDFARSSAILYRGSSSVLYAVRFGLKPIYVRNGPGADLDSLFELCAWKEEVGAAGELADSLRRYAGADPAALEREWRVAREFVRSYAIPVAESSFAELAEALS